MKELRLEIEKLEERIAPGCTFALPGGKIGAFVVPPEAEGVLANALPDGVPLQCEV